MHALQLPYTTFIDQLPRSPTRLQPSAAAASTFHFSFPRKVDNQLLKPNIKAAILVFLRAILEVNHIK